MHKLAALILILCLAIPGFSAARKTRRSSPSKATASKTTPKAAPPKTSAKKAAPGSKSRKSSTASRRRRPVRKSWRTGQMQPTPERYREIQQALIDKGFFRGEANGVWGADSIEALRAFQQAQNLEPSGKIDSLSLIALGLGPRRTTAIGSLTPSDSGSSTREQQ